MNCIKEISPLADPIEHTSYEKTDVKYIWKNSVTGKFAFEDEAGMIEGEFDSKEEAKTQLDNYVAWLTQE